MTDSPQPGPYGQQPSLLTSVPCAADKATFDQMRKAAPKGRVFLRKKLPRLNLTLDDVKVNETGHRHDQIERVKRSTHTLRLGIKAQREVGHGHVIRPAGRITLDYVTHNCIDRGTP
jgi:hypothetical protein